MYQPRLTARLVDLHGRGDLRSAGDRAVDGDHTDAATATSATSADLRLHARVRRASDGATLAATTAVHAAFVLAALRRLVVRAQLSILPRLSGARIGSATPSAAVRGERALDIDRRRLEDDQPSRSASAPGPAVLPTGASWTAAGTRAS